MSDVKDVVKDRYGRAALRVVSGEGAACCGAGPSSCCSGADPITSNLYEQLQKDELPEAAVLASLGCGNPTALAELKPGEVVLDLGSGDGIDVLLSARRVAPGGKAYGLDMTDEMLGLARENQQKSGVENVEFLKGENVLLWVGCVAGALDETEYRAKLAAAGFDAIGIEPTRVYRTEDALSFLADQGLDLTAIGPQVDGKFMSAFVRARKPTPR